MDTSNLVDPQSDAACDPWKIKATQAALAQGIISEEEDYMVLIYNLSRFRRGVQQVHNAFPESYFLHTTALKANPVLSLLEFAQTCGLGFEAASLGELTQALRVAKDPKTVVFDSPVKTIKELKFALEKGVYLNLDNWQELERVDKLVKENNYPTVNVGLRINPQVGAGKIKEMGTAVSTSKFGIAVDKDYETIYKAYLERPWLNGIHVHVGSQGIPMDLANAGIHTIVEIATEINKRKGSQQVQFIDIGGGLAVNFDSEEDDSPAAGGLATYSALLRETSPELFSGKFKVITEFGRRYNAKPGFVVSRIEYSKVSGGRRIATTHGGTDLFVRTIFMPTKWALRVTVLNSKGEKKKGELIPHDIAGPCCIAADIIAHERPLPLMEQGDWVITHDTGGYYYSAFSHYNVRQAPAIYGFEEEDPIKLKLLKKGQSIEEALEIFT